MKKYKHIFFDLDETLWDFKSNSLESLHDIFDQHELVKHGIEKEKFIKRYNHHNDFYWDKFRKGEIAREQLRIIRFEKTLNEFEVSDGALVKTLSENYLKILPTKKNLLSDAIDVLDYLKPNYSLHIITNGFEEVQHEKIRTSGLTKYFSYVITSERAGSHKPNREIFLYAFSVTNALLNESIFVGDSIEADIKGAKAIGMDCVLFNPEKSKHNEKVDWEISELKQLMSIL